MSDTIIVSLFSLLGTCIGSGGGLRLMSYRIKQLEKKVDKHNHFAERMPVIEEQVKVINHRIDDLEQERKE